VRILSILKKERQKGHAHSKAARSPKEPHLWLRLHHRKQFQSPLAARETSNHPKVAFVFRGRKRAPFSFLSSAPLKPTSRSRVDSKDISCHLFCISTSYEILEKKSLVEIVPVETCRAFGSVRYNDLTHS
jgi:hypothetical protein